MKRLVFHAAGLPLAGALVFLVLFLLWKVLSPDLLITFAGGPTEMALLILSSTAALFLPAGIFAFLLFEYLGRRGARVASFISYMLRMMAVLLLASLGYLGFVLMTTEASAGMRHVPVIMLLPPVGLIAAALLWPVRRVLGLDSV